jgi:nitrite reductase/ring-hydroxylating ferredoxin subunit
MAFVRIASVQDVPPGQSRQVKVQNRTIALFHIDGSFFAVDDTCPHRGAPLWEGQVEGTEVTCPWHGARFDLTSGAHLCPPARSGVASYAVRVNGDAVELDIP